LGDLLEWLDDHVNLEADPAPRAAAMRLDRMRRIVELLGDPQIAYPVLHITGTNGKGSTARMITTLLVARGLSVGTYTSPDLERVNERLAWNGEPIDDAAFAGVLDVVRALEPVLDESPTRFEILTAAALVWFADVAVDAAVVEVGLGGRWDATNVVDGQVAVVTNVSLDHQDVIGPTRDDIAREKAGIVKPGSTLVLGETDPGPAAIFLATDAGAIWRRDEDFGCVQNQLAHGGRLLELRTPGATYEDVLLPVHGAHQGDNAALALAAVEAFFGAPLAPDLVAEAFAAVQLPGRMEVVGRKPLTVLDGAHNPAGAAALAAAVDEAFGGLTGRVLVVGFLAGRDPEEMLTALGAGRARLVVACPPPSPRALPPERLAAAARGLGLAAAVVPSVREAVTLAREVAEPDEMVLITGSLYVVGTARAVLRGAPTTH
jgi:dihydrofolate synthase/folylpolyglutamate synthase